MDEHSLIIGFRDFIATNWGFINSLDKQDESDALLIDWLQVNWEMLVERHLPLPILLEVYGDGADNGKSSRIEHPDANATHMVVCAPKAGSVVYDCLNKVEVSSETKKFVFDRFVSVGVDGWYYEEPPFDKVLCFIDSDADRKEMVLNIDSIEFQTVPTTFDQ